jgi:hypothetical protein
LIKSLVTPLGVAPNIITSHNRYRLLDCQLCIAQHRLAQKISKNPDSLVHSGTSHRPFYLVRHKEITTAIIVLYTNKVDIGTFCAESPLWSQARPSLSKLLPNN